MRLIRIIAYTLIMNCAILFSAEPVDEGRLYIVNTHPKLQFECKYSTHTTEGAIIDVPTVVYRDKIYLGRIRDIRDIQIKRYGRYLGAGAKYYSYAGLLDECRKRPDQDCMLQINPAFNLETWDVAKSKEIPTTKAIIRPLEYFVKALEYGAAAEPRHILDLPEEYSEAHVTQREQTLSELIQSDKVLEPMSKYVLAILKMSAKYARALLGIRGTASSSYQKLLIEFRGQLHPKRIIRGKQIACQIEINNLQKLGRQTEYLDAIVDLMWYLYSIAIEKGQAFEEGTFVIEDKQLLLYNFLMNYIKMVNPSIKGTLEDPALNISKNTYAYSRSSSHFMQEQRQFRHYGIDIRYPTDILAQALLPAYKSHILFGNLGNGYIFIKPENAGIAAQSAPTHGAEFLAAQTRKLLPGIRSYLRDYVPTYLDELALYYIGTDDDPNYRKERVPQEVIQKSLEIVKKSNINQAQMQRITLQFAQQGIHGIRNELQNQASPIADAKKRELEEYLLQLYRTEGYDHQGIRYGREVIISQDHITRGCK